MVEDRWLAEQFEQNRGHLRGVAYRILGSVAEADDAVQEAWLRLSRSDAGVIDNLGGWLTTVVARVCLDTLRSRRSRREESLDALENQAATPSPSPDPEQEALMADSVGLALLVVLEKLSPAERLAFVLHDTFDLPFDEIAAIIGRSTDATRQLASRARRRVRGVDLSNKADLAQQRKTIELSSPRCAREISHRLWPYSTLTSWFTPILSVSRQALRLKFAAQKKRLVRRSSLRAAPPLRARPWSTARSEWSLPPADGSTGC